MYSKDIILINKNHRENLGNLYIKWTNYLCEVAETYSPLVTFEKINTELELYVIDPP